MKHYLAVLVPRAEGGWRVHFPDFPGCRAEGATVEQAIDASAAAVAKQARWLSDNGVSLPTPQTYEEVRYHSKDWAAHREIHWSQVVVSVVPLRIAE
jgi:predicted RNase H-like HicB family nuclease